MKLGSRKMPFGYKARAQQAAIASSKAANQNEPFIEVAARTSKETSDAILAIFPLGSRWASRFTGDAFRVEEVTEYGDVIMVREPDGLVVEVDPRKARRSAWERLDDRV
jgi:hypothetical protein